MFDGWNVKTVESYSTDRTESEETLMVWRKSGHGHGATY